jgi:hypothetical protein
LSDAVATFETIVDRELARWGGPSSDAPVPADAPPVVQVLDRVRRNIRGEGGQPSLRERVASADPSGEVGAIYTEAGLGEALRELNAGLSRVPPLQRTQAPGRVPDWSPESLTPADLDNLMRVQSVFESQSSGRNKNLYDAASQGFAAAGLFAAGSGVGTPVAAAFGTASAVTGQMVLFMGIMAGILPGALGELTLNGETVSFEEDHPKPEGRWRGDLYASSKGYKLDVTTAASLLPGFGDLAQIRAAFRGAEAVELGLNTEFTQFTLGYLNSTWGMLRGVANADGLAEIQPKVIGPIRIDATRDQDLIQWQVSSRVFTLDAADPHIYRGLEAGVAVLVVRTRPGRFAGKSARSSMDLEVRPILVTLFGPDGRSDLSRIPRNQTVPVRAVVENALNPCLRWRTVNGGALTPPSDCGTPNAGFSASESGLYGLEAESMAQTGIRASRTPKRFAGITMRVGGLELIPGRVACMERGETKQFAVEKWAEPVTYSMQFEAQGGTITPDGQFTATTIGTGVVRVTDPQEPDLRDEVSVDIREECPGWRMTLGGSIAGTWEGRCATYTSVDYMRTMGATLMPREEALATPAMYQLFDGEGNQVSVMVANPTPLNRDKGPSRARSIFSVITFPQRPGLMSPTGTFAVNADRQPGLSVEHTWKENPKGSGQLLYGTMSGVLYQDPDKKKTSDGAPVRVEIVFKGMGAAVNANVVGMAPILSGDVEGMLRDPLRLVCTGPEAGSPP